MRNTFAAVALLGHLFIGSNVIAATAAEVLSISPTGSVKNIQQVRVTFATDMVPLGDPRSKTDPFLLECNQVTKQQKVDPANAAKKKSKKTAPPTFKTRWIDSKNWSLDFDQPLVSGMACDLKIRKDLKDLLGQTVTYSGATSFTTSGPALLGVSPRYGSIEPEQYFVLRLDGDMDAKSVESLAYFESTKIADKIQVAVVNGPDRDAVLRAAIHDNWNFKDVETALKSQDPARISEALKYFIVISGTRRFPEGEKLVLHWPAGILSKSGLPSEDPQEFEFEVMNPFEAKLNCERASADRPCNPILDIQLNFTNRVPLKSLKGAELVDPKGAITLPVEFANGDQNKNFDSAVGATAKSATGFSAISNFADAEVDHLTFKGPFPPNTNYTLKLPKDVRDEIGRTLENQAAFPLKFSTDAYSPLVKFAADFGVLELAGEPILPVSLRNVEKILPARGLDYQGKDLVLKSDAQPREIIATYHALLKKSYDFETRGTPFLPEGKGLKFTLPKPGGTQDFELVGIPLKTAGLHIVELNSPKLGEALLGGGTMYVASAALVTDLAVHFKKGRESSAVWVTQLHNAQPLAGVDVALFSSDGKELASGKTDASGLWRSSSVKYNCSWDSTTYKDCEVFAFAKKGDDFSFASSTWSKGIEDYRFNLKREYLSSQWGPVTAHSILDRAIVKAGESVHIKHIVREYTGLGFRALPAKYLPRQIYITHAGSNKRYSLPFTYDKITGSAISTFKLPNDAALGLYRISLSNQAPGKNATSDDDAEDDSESPSGNGPDSDRYDYNALETGTFLVSEYRLPLMESTVKIKSDFLVQPKTVPVDLSASYLSGGAAAGLKVKLRANLEPFDFEPDAPAAKEFTFFSTPTVAGLTNDEPQRSQEDKFLFAEDLQLDKNGGLNAEIKGVPASRDIKSLRVEMEYRDPNGEVKTASATQPIFPSEAIVGLRADESYNVANKVSVTGITVSQDGKILPGAHFTVQAFKRDFITHRKRLVGGFYAYDSKTKIDLIGEVCQGSSDEFGRFNCRPGNLPAGTILLQAQVKDKLDRPTYATVDVTVFDHANNNWWTPSNDDRMDLLPEKVRYEPGQSAKIVVRSPFPKSTVLVTVEREGVLDAFVREITREQSTIEVPIKDNYGPNVFVSALALRGRVGEPQPTALIDLAKPAMKLGITELRVGWKAHELKVTVSTEKSVYHTRDKVPVTVHVTSPNGAPLPAGAEVALVAVDQALGRLRKNWSVDVLLAMMGQRGLAVDTSTSQNQVIGKRHFGAKAKPPGGGGGGDTLGSREIFNPVLSWEPHLKLDANGDAHFTVPLNDSITGFEITAVAQAGMDFFGSGHEKITATKDLIIYSGFAPVVRDGDNIVNAFTLRNTTAQAMKVAVLITSPQLPKLDSNQLIDIPAGSAKTLQLKIEVPPGLKEIAFNLNAKDQVTGLSDALKTVVRVDESVPVRIQQATLSQLVKTESIPVQMPKAALPGRGGIVVSVSPRLARSLEGVKSVMESYPYTCLEQKVSRAIVLDNDADLKQLIEQLPSYLDSDGLLKFFPSSIYGWEQLSRYVLNILKANAQKLPEATQARLLDGLKAYLNGRTEHRNWWSDLVRDNYKIEERVLIIDTLSRYGEFKAEMLASVSQTPNLWRTATLVAWMELLGREKAIQGREAKLKQAEQILRARVNVQGTVMNLQGEPDWEASWHLFTSRDQEALDVFGLAIDSPSWQSDIGRMARGTLGRFRRGAWDTTLANAWGVTWMRKFSAKYENEKMSGKTEVASVDTKLAVDWSQSANGKTLSLPWPKGTENAPSPVTVTQVGSGKPWVSLQTTAAIPITAPWDLGYSITKTITPVNQGTAGPWKSGDVASVELIVTAKNDQSWVVIRDPIPAGASILGAGLEDTSAILDKSGAKAKTPQESTAWPTEFEEKSLSHFTSYAAYLPKGRYRLSYRVRLNSAGVFKLPPTRAEAMYSPEVFGESPNANWSVAP